MDIFIEVLMEIIGGVFEVAIGDKLERKVRTYPKLIRVLIFIALVLLVAGVIFGIAFLVEFLTEGH